MKSVNTRTVVGRRKVLQPFELSDGSRASIGDWICVPQKAIIQDEQHYSGAKVFDARRFLGKSRLTDVAYPWVAWGCGKTTW
jgi:cytochrome P450